MRHPGRIVLGLLSVLAVLAAGCEGVTVNRTPAPETAAPAPAPAPALTPQMLELEKGVAAAPAPAPKVRGPRTKGVKKPKRSEQIRKRGRDRIRSYKQNLRSIEQARRDLAQPGGGLHRPATRREIQNLQEKNRKLRDQIHQDYREWRDALKEERGG